VNRKIFSAAAWLGVALALLSGGCATPTVTAPRVEISGAWRGVHLWVDRERRAQELIRTLPALAAAGANTVVIEVNYSYQFRSHPELRQKTFVTRKTAHALAAAARANGIRLIPEFNCLGHQSFGKRIEPLLKLHPEFSETPLGVMRETNSFYCLCWCPRAPEVNEMVFQLIDEIAVGFEADAIHVGMDETYYLAEDGCPRCHGARPAEIFTAQVEALHAHIVGEKKLEMLMWADRVIGPKYQGWSRFDNTNNLTGDCTDWLPRDIVMCDWHYEWRKEYPSVPYLVAKGYRVWPSGFLPLKAAQQFSDYSRGQGTNVVGWLATTWNQTSITNSPSWPPIKEILRQWKP
jgi:hypothetical protein